MIRFLWKSKGSPKAPSLDDVDLDLERIPGAVKTVNGFPRIEWPLVHQAAARYADHPALGQIWTELAAQWLGIIRRHLGEQYRIYEGEYLLLLSTQDSGAAGVFCGSATMHTFDLNALCSGLPSNVAMASTW